VGAQTPSGTLLIIRSIQTGGQMLCLRAGFGPWNAFAAVPQDKSFCLNLSGRTDDLY